MNMFQAARGAAAAKGRARWQALAVAADLIRRIDECQVRREAPPARSLATKNGF
jgi:hypothetical protein